eukprot:TRINITY_DN540_c0_g1_i2.p1 TRINITY_DN540_c0_g1~~TRINITY_DN540_c0_g1_i2.p1  ORF type:complete len:210 (-),score=27.65 TRINITY_DN540_c0_g1_i2:474-1103(-)
MTCVAMFVNPPFSQLPQWIMKALIEIALGHAVEVVMFIPAATDCIWFRTLIFPNANKVVDLGSITFDGWERPLRGSCLAVRFSRDGTRCWRKNDEEWELQTWRKDIDSNNHGFQGIPDLATLQSTETESQDQHQNRLRSLIVGTRKLPAPEEEFTSGLECFKCSQEAIIMSIHDECQNLLCSACKSKHDEKLTHHVILLRNLASPRLGQ